MNPHRTNSDHELRFFGKGPRFLEQKVGIPFRRVAGEGRRFWRATGTNVSFATGKDLEQRLAEQDFAGVLHAPETFRSMETLGTINVDGKACFQVLLVRKNGGRKSTRLN